MADTSSDTIAPPVAPAPPGLINTAPGVSNTTPGSSTVTGYTPGQATAGQATATGYTAAPYTVDPNATVAGQIRGIIAEGSPLMQQAEAGARGTMNARGLINSSDAITAGQSAVMSAALPIATADAATFDRAATNTTTAKNTEAGATAGATNTASLQNSQLTTQNSQFNTGQTDSALSQSVTASNQKALQDLIGSQQLKSIDAQGVVQTKLQDMSDNNKLLLQTSQNASQYYTTMLQYMTSITTDPRMTMDAKAAALNNAVTTLNDALDTMTTIAGIPGVQSTLNFTGASMGPGTGLGGTGT